MGKRLAEEECKVGWRVGTMLLSPTSSAGTMAAVMAVDTPIDRLRTLE